jgi:hypothetical protein
MIDKCSIEYIYYFIFILFGIFVVTFCIYYIITLRFKYANVLEKFAINQEHPPNPNFRQCQVYFLNDGEINDIATCDKEYRKNPETTTCKYVFDGWQERDNQVDERGNTLTYKNKVFTNKVLDKNGFLNFREDTRCFKETTSTDESSENIHRFGDKDYIFQEFDSGASFNSGICNISFPIATTIKSLKFYKFILDKSNKITDVKLVNIKENEKGFDIDPTFNISKFTNGQSYGIEYHRFDARTKKHIFKIFQISTFPLINVNIYTFKYNYICDPTTQVMYKNVFNTQISIGKFISLPASSSGIEYSFPIMLPGGGETFKWDDFKNNDANNREDKKQLIVNKLIERRAVVAAEIAKSLTARELALKNEWDKIEEQSKCDITCLNQFKDNNKMISDLLRKIFTSNKITSFKNKFRYIKKEADTSNRVYDDIIIKVKNTFTQGLTKYVIDYTGNVWENKDMFDEPILSQYNNSKQDASITNFTNLSLNANKTNYFTGFFYVPITGNYKFMTSSNSSPRLTTCCIFLNNIKVLNSTTILGETLAHQFTKGDIVKIDIYFKSYGQEIRYKFGWKFASNSNYNYQSTIDGIKYFLNKASISKTDDNFMDGRFLMNPKKIPGETSDYYYEFKDTDLQYGIEIKKTVKCDILVVGGGGGGGGGIGGGGGAGAVLYLESVILPIGTHALKIGTGGIGRYRLLPSDNGNDSYISGNFGKILAEGGGGTTGGHDHGDGLVGGSGGGAAGPNGTLNTGGAAGTKSSLGGFFGSMNGNRGGNNTKNRHSGVTNATGGGGAGGPAQDTEPSSGAPGHGGIGIEINITGQNVYYGGGGGGGGHHNAGNGGQGGGGNGSPHGNGSHGTPNTGGGGGGGAWEAPIGGNGGSGIIIIRIKMSKANIIEGIDFSRQKLST